MLFSPSVCLSVNIFITDFEEDAFETSCRRLTGCTYWIDWHICGLPWWVSVERIEGAINSFEPFKAPGLLLPWFQDILTKSLRLGYTPVVRLIFILKAGKKRHTSPKNTFLMLWETFGLLHQGQHSPRTDLLFTELRRLWMEWKGRWGSKAGIFL